MNLLFIGNSYTYFNDLPAMVEALARENGKSVKAFSVTKGGYTLSGHIKDADSVALMDSITCANSIDVCVLQEQSILPVTDFDSFLCGARAVCEKLRGSASRFVMYSTWGRKDGSATLTEHAWTSEGMTNALAGAYERVGKAIGADVAYVGLNFRKIYVAHPEIDLYDTDLTHPSYHGSALATITLYQKIFGDIPVSAKSLNVSEDVVALYKSVVAENN